MRRAAGEEAVADAGALIEAFAALWPESSLAQRDKDGIRVLTWSRYSRVAHTVPRMRGDEPALEIAQEWKWAPQGW